MGVGCFISHGSHRAKDCPKREKVSALQWDSDLETRNLETRLNLIRMVIIIHKSNSIFVLMYMAIQVNGIEVKVLVDTEAIHTCVVSSVATTLGLTIEAYDSVVKSLNDMDHWLEGIIKSCLMEMGEWLGCYDLVVMHLQDFKIIIEMNFLTQVELCLT